jgi:DNA-binding IclR family transcriptional regulator
MFCGSTEIRLSEAAERLGVAQSTAHRLLSMLVYHGFAIQDGRGRAYQVGPMLLEMGLGAIQNFDLGRQARGVLEKLQSKVNETVHIAVPYGQHVLYVQTIESSHALKIGSRVGTLLPAHCVGLGKAILATLTTEELRDLYPNSELPTLTERSIRSLSQLEQQLAKIRRLGYARSRGESEDGVGSIGVAVIDQEGVARAAISIAAPISRMAPEKEPMWVEAALEAAKELASNLWSKPGISLKGNGRRRGASTARKKPKAA